MASKHTAELRAMLKTETDLYMIQQIIVELHKRGSM